MDPLQESSTKEQWSNRTEDHIEISATQKVNFCDVPFEIRSQIWALAIPNPRIIKLYVPIPPESGGLSIIGPFSSIPTICHICQESRAIGLSIFERGYNNLDTPRNNFYWNPKQDTVYILPYSYQSFKFYSVSTQWSSAAGEVIRSMPSIRHLMIPFHRPDLRFFGFVTKSDIKIKWLHSFSNLESITFAIERFSNWQGELYWPFDEAMDTNRNIWGSHGHPYHTGATLVLYEPLDIPITYRGYCSTTTSAKLEETLTSAFERFAEQNYPSWRPPSAQIRVLGRKRFKRSGFCTPVPTKELEKEEWFKGDSWSYNRSGKKVKSVYSLDAGGDQGLHPYVYVEDGGKERRNFWNSDWGSLADQLPS